MKRRILSLALASAMVVGPVAGAFAETDNGSTEVKSNSPYIQGYEDGTFKPNNNVTRQEMAKMIAGAIDAEGGQSNFADSDTIGDWADAAVAGLQELEILKGDAGTNNFRPTAKISRAELAAIIVRAYEETTGEELSTGEVSFDDVSDDAWYAEEVKKAAAAGLVKGMGEGKFGPESDATRAQTVTMVNRMLGFGEGNVEGAADLETDFTDAADWPEWAKEAILIASSEFDYTVGEDGKIVVVTEEEEEELKVESVSAITTTLAEVKFNKDLGDVEFDRNDIVTEDQDGDRIFVKQVDLSGDTAAIEYYQDFADGSTYTMTITVGEETYEGTLEYVEGEASEFTVYDQKVDSKGTGTYDIKYSLKSDTGIDLTEKLKDSVKVTSSKASAVSDKGVVNLNNVDDGEIIFVELDYKDISSDRFRIIGEDAEAALTDAFTIANVGDSIDWDNDDMVNSIKKGQTGKAVFFNFEDQFGEEVSGATLEYESLTPNLLLVDRKTGALTTRGVGMADIKVTSGDYEAIVTLEVLEEAEIASIEFKDYDENELNLSNKVSISEDIQVRLLDQYGDEFEKAGEELTVRVNGDTARVAAGTSTASTVINDGKERVIDTGATGAIQLDVKSILNKEGTTTITVIHDDARASFEVNVLEAGEAVGYDVSGLRDLDLNSEDRGGKNDDTYNITKNLELFPVDANGVKTANALTSNITWTVKDSDGDKVDDTTVSKPTIGLDGGTIKLPNTKTEAYTLEVKVGSLVVATETINVVDTAVSYTVNQTENNITLVNDGSGDKDLLNTLKDAFEVKQGSTEHAITDFKLVSDNSSIVDASTSTKATDIATNIVTSEDGKATLAIESVYADGKEHEVDFLIEIEVISLLDGETYTGNLELINNGQTYGPAGAGEETTIDGDVTVIEDDITLQNTVINGDLIVGDTSDDITLNDFTMNNVTVKGDLIVKEGSVSTITVTDSDIEGNVQVDKEGVRLALTGSTTVDGNIVFNVDAYLDLTGADDATIFDGKTQSADGVTVGDGAAAGEASDLAAAKTALTDAIAAAQEVADNAVVGEAAGNYPEAAKETFVAAIATAQGVLDNAESTTETLGTAKTTLDTAVTTFEGTVIGTGVEASATVTTQGKDAEEAVAATATVQNIDITADTAGVAGNDITVSLVDPGGASQALGVVVTDSAIVVNLATDGDSAITTTVAEVIEALNTADSDQAALVDAALVAEADGTAVVTATAEPVSLENGADEEAAVAEVSTLTVTSGAAATGTIVVTVGEATTDVAVTAEMTTAQVAAAIADAVTVEGYTVAASDATVTFTADVAGVVEDLAITVADK